MYISLHQNQYSNIKILFFYCFLFFYNSKLFHREEQSRRPHHHHINNNTTQPLLSSQQHHTTNPLTLLLKPFSLSVCHYDFPYSFTASQFTSLNKISIKHNKSHCQKPSSFTFLPRYGFLMWFFDVGSSWYWSRLLVLNFGFGGFDDSGDHFLS